MESGLVSHPAFLLAVAILGPLVRDFVVQVLRARAKAARTDKDPTNDAGADVLEAAADALEKAKGASLLKGKK